MFFYTFREREDLLDLVDQITGHRMNNAYIRIGGVGNEIPEQTLKAVRAFAERMDQRVDEYEHLLTGNKIWWDRNRDVGVLDKDLALSLGLTGPNLRGSGIEHDLRRAQPYSGYENYDFEIPVGTVGDCYDRYLVRMEEMRQSARIILQAIDKLPPGEIYAEDRRFVLPPKDKVFTSMEELIHQFKVVTEMRVPRGEIYSAVEASKGELAFYLVADDGPHAHRLHVRSPSFLNIQAIPHLSRGIYISDMVAIIGSLDFVMGECDR
jgi:NADH-quinone oxidoreductase subunit D